MLDPSESPGRRHAPRQERRHSCVEEGLSGLPFRARASTRKTWRYPGTCQCQRRGTLAHRPRPACINGGFLNLFQTKAMKKCAGVPALSSDFQLIRTSRLRSSDCTPYVLLRHQPEPDHGKVMIERVCKTNSRALHDRKTGGIDGRQLMQVRTSKVLPRLLQIAQLAGKDFRGAGLIDGFFPRQRHVPVGVAIEKCERLDDNGNGGVKLRARSVQQVPLLPCLRMERISRQREGYPCPAVDEHRLPLPH